MFLHINNKIFNNMEYTFTEKQLKNVIAEAVKIYLKEEEDAYLYGAKPDGNIPMDMEKNLEGADIQINSAGTIHIEHCETEDNHIKMYDDDERELIINTEDVEKLLDGETVEAELRTYSPYNVYEVFISIAHASDNQRIIRYMRDRQRGDSPIFGGSKL